MILSVKWYILEMRWEKFKNITFSDSNTGNVRYNIILCWFYALCTWERVCKKTHISIPSIGHSPQNTPSWGCWRVQEHVGSGHLEPLEVTQPENHHSDAHFIHTQMWKMGRLCELVDIVTEITFRIERSGGTSDTMILQKSYTGVSVNSLELHSVKWYIQ